MNLNDYNSEAERVGAPPQYRGAVITVHGMNTRGAWQKVIGPMLQDALIRHVPVDYGWKVVSIVRRRTCDAVAHRILAAYEEQIRYHPAPSGLGHSFGSLAIARSLKLFPDLKMSRLILIGSIVSCDYPWDYVHARGQVAAVLNERSASDIWPRLARFAIPDSGPSGVSGFRQQHPFITETDSPWTGHSGLSHPLHCRQVWIPFLLGM